MSREDILQLISELNAALEESRPGRAGAQDLAKHETTPSVVTAAQQLDSLLAAYQEKLGRAIAALLDLLEDTPYPIRPVLPVDDATLQGVTTEVSQISEAQTYFTPPTASEFGNVQVQSPIPKEK